MKTLLVVLFLALAGGSSSSSFADEPASAAPASTSRLPGVDLAEGISQITGTGISPLLGVCSVGVWRYYHTPEALRGALPWFCQPAAWGIGFGLLGLCLLKDIFGTMAPALVKKPFDMAELFESKLSALIASAAFVPIIASQMAEHFSTAAASSPQAQVGLASSLHLATVLPIGTMVFDCRWLLLPLSLVSFFVVWMTSHAINVLITMCPFGVVDAALKLAKTALLSSLVVAYAISPYLGGALSLVIILIAAWFAPAAFRLTTFGTLFALDTILGSRARRWATPDQAHAFAGVAAGLPARTYGRVIRGADGSVHFSFRPWLVLPRRVIPLPAEGLALSKGVFFPSLLHRPEAAVAYTRVALFLPRYRTHEETLAGHFEIAEIRDSALTKGFKAIRAWFAEVVSAKRPEQPLLE